MNDLLGITDYLWRLIPANPILLRVVATASKRKRDLAVRCIYLGALIAVVLFAIARGGSSPGGTSLSDLTRTSANIFQSLSYLQLGLVALLAPIFTAGAITQEKDSQTYDILLTTPLTNGQVVLGSLMSRLFFVIALLISGVPIFSVTQIFGGVAIQSIVKSFLIAASTAMVTGALAMAIATFKVGTRRTIFSFYMFIVIYMIGGILLDRIDYFRVALIDPATGQISTELSQTSWFTALNPFLALRAIFNDKYYLPPDLSLLPEHLRGFPFGWMLASPNSFYVSFMFFLSIVLVMPSIMLLRRMAQSTTNFRGWLMQKLRISSGDKTRKPRGVWNNPIAWREAKTKASAARAYFMRYGFITAGVLGAVILVLFYSRKTDVANFIGPGSYNAAENTLFIQGKNPGNYLIDPAGIVITIKDEPQSLDVLWRKLEVSSFQTSTDRRGRKFITVLDLKPIPRMLDETAARNYLLGLVMLEAAVILLIITNAAASTVTREKEDGTLDLLLSTPITSRYYIWGKLRGLVSFILPLVAVPLVSCVLFILYDCLRLLMRDDAAFKWIVFPEATILLPVTLVIVAAFGGILGMQMSLRCRTTVRAVMSSVGIMLGVCGALGWCGFGFLATRGMDNIVRLAFSSFSPFTLMAVLIDPYNLGGKVFEQGSEGDVVAARVVMFTFGLIAAGVYAALVWSMYKSMVKNFDMTIRRQSR